MGELRQETDFARPRGPVAPKPPAGPGTLPTPEPADDEVIITPEDERAAVAQPRYVWSEMPGKVRHVWAAHLEVRSDEPPV